MDKKASALPVPALIYWMCAWTFVGCVGQTCALLLNGVGSLKGQMIYGTLTCLVTLMLMPLLTVKFGVYGAPMALTLSYVTINLPATLFESFLVIRRLKAAPRSEPSLDLAK